jgi:hypothetical protein
MKGKVKKLVTFTILERAFNYCKVH